MPVVLACVSALIVAGWLGCSSFAVSERLATLEERVELLTEETLALEHRTQTLPHDVEMLSNTVRPLERSMWARQASLADGLIELREVVMPQLTGQIEELAQALRMVQRHMDELHVELVQQRSQEARSQFISAPGSGAVEARLERIQDDILVLQHTTVGLKYLLDQAQADHQQAFATSTTWLAAVAEQLERYRQLARKPAPGHYSR